MDAFVVRGWRRRSRGRGLAGFGTALGGAFCLLLLAGGLFFYGLDYTIAGPLIAALSLVVFLASVLVAILPTRRSSPEAT